ncbi:MAG: hypothetical protein JSR46_07965 [Verrucomicrobia bacterium]|nr:hypothetical protein [Verrucomicrobiota bacterium]
MRIESGPDNLQFVHFRRCDATYHPLHVQFEAAMIASYRITRGDSVPKIRPVVNASDDVIGSASYSASPWYHSANDLSSQAVSEMIRKDIGQAFVRPEDAMHSERSNNVEFLKEVLIDPETHMNIMKPYFAQTFEGQEIFEKLKACVAARWNVLEEHLVSSKAFRSYLVCEKNHFHETAFTLCLDHFKRYNEQGVQFNLDSLKERFYKILKKCILKDAIQAIYDLSPYLKSQMIALFEAFEESQEPLWPLFCALREQLNLEEHNPLHTVVESYRNSILFESQDTPAPVKLMSTKRAECEIKEEPAEIALAHAVKKFLTDQRNLPRIVSIIQNCLTRYQPLGHGTKLQSLNPMSFFRVRTDDIGTLLDEVRAARVSKIVDFLGTGGWYETGYTREPSVNVMLLSGLCLAAVEHYKSELTLAQLKADPFVLLCYSIDKKELNIEKLAQQIYQQLQGII